jgi:hypothetical protein
MEVPLNGIKKLMLFLYSKLNRYRFYIKEMVRNSGGGNNAKRQGRGR